MKRLTQLLSAGIFAFSVLCSKSPTVSVASTGDLELWLQFQNAIAKKEERHITTYDSLVVEVSGTDLETIRYAKPIKSDLPFVKDTITKIPAGNNRALRIITINKNGEIIHKDSAEIRYINILPNTLNLLQVFLIPIKGSIYIQLGGIPVSVDSILATFTDKNGNKWRSVVKREPKVSISIDNIPDKSEGNLVVSAFTVGGDTLYRAQKEIKIDTRKNNIVNLSFEQIVSGVEISVSLQKPAVVAAFGSIGKMVVAEEESGELIITEIMYSVNDSEYIELYNPSTVEKSIDTLYIDIDGDKILFTEIKIPAKGFYVIGRQSLPWVDNWTSVKNALDLSTVSGNWITLISKEGKIIDQVIFTAGKNSIEWPYTNGKSSICLKKEFFSAIDNNYGFNWEIAQSFIEGTTLQGTPHK
ncbi:MAG: lamin tail domain-containing protein [Chitinispirillaceae bacterium]|nr:lamin tail domain-containing protein [Chitinispirillaceae bacterium]